MMGTDIYLTYDEQPEKYSCNDKEYIRAAIWMTEENTMLRIIFPEEVWKSSDDFPYDFDMNVEVLRDAAQDYALGVSSKVTNAVAEKTKEMIAEALEGLGTLEFGGDDLTPDEKTEWLQTVISFFKRGWELQKAGKNPKIYISW